MNSDEFIGLEDFGVEIETTDEIKKWKPQLVFENKNRKNPNEEKSVVMKINDHIPSYLMDVEVSPFLDGKFLPFNMPFVNLL
jgi:hypothetical protein